ncbi:MAG: deoxyribose-phosphate aldolase [Pyrinomonadaceae bacterium]
MSFDAKKFLPVSILEQVTELRVSDPELSMRVARERRRRESVAPKGRLNILASDHPARRVTRVGDDPFRMADRREYLARTLRVLQSEVVDGVLATMDIIEDLLVIHELMKRAGGPAFLDDKLLVASLNRAGLLGSAWEIDDPMSGPSPAACAEWRLDGTKVLLRLCDSEPDSLKTLLATVRAISEQAPLKLPMFLESLPVEKVEGGYRIIKTAEELTRTAGAAAALGDSSRYVWLKLPYCENYEMVARSTTLPILLLGGEPVGDVRPFLRELASGLKAGPNVRGALVGRNVLFPGDGDPFAAAEAAGGLVHRGWTLEQALDTLETAAGRDTDWLARIA